MADPRIRRSVRRDPLRMRGGDQQAKIHEDKSVRTPDPFRWIYLLLVAGMGLVLLDRHLEPKAVTSTVVEVNGTTVNTSTRRTKSTAYWSVFTLADGTRFQAERQASAWHPGELIDVELSALLGTPTRFRRHGGVREQWEELGDAAEEFKPLPYVVAACALLLLLPWWGPEARWLIQGILGVMLVSWTFILFGTHVLELGL